MNGFFDNAIGDLQLALALSVAGAVLGALVLLAILIRSLRRWYIALRNERQLETHMQARRGFKALKGGGYVYPEKWL